jgi:hypothetical protein
LLSDETSQSSNFRILGPHVSGVPGDPLESAIAYVCGNARTTGEEPFGIRQQAACIQRDAIVRWAEESGLIVDPSLWRGKAVLGGSEHDIVLELRKRGFLLVPDFFIGSEPDSSFYHEREGIAIFDATCDNFILSHGIPMAVDVVVVPVGDLLRQQLAKLMSQNA